MHYTEEAYNNTGKRLIAIFIDYLLFWLIKVPLYLWAIKSYKTYWNENLPYFEVLSDVVFLLYLTLMTAKYGASLGKMIFKLKVVDYTTMGKVRLKGAIIRELPNVIVVVLPLLLLHNSSSTDMYPFPFVASGVSYSGQELVFLLGLGSIVWFVIDNARLMNDDLKRRSLRDWLAGTVVLDQSKLSNQLENHQFGDQDLPEEFQKSSQTWEERV